MASQRLDSLIHDSMGTSYFFSLVRPKAVRKMRSCLKCHTEFVSRGAGHRICSSCAEHNGRLNSIAGGQ